MSTCALVGRRTAASLWCATARALSGVAMVSIAAMPLAARAQITLERLADVGGDTIAIRAAGDGSGRLFVVRRAGDIVILDSASNTVRETPFLDIGTLVDDEESEQGLLGLAFHPDFTSNGYLFVNYTRHGTPDRTVIARYQVLPEEPNRADADSARVLLEIEQDDRNHNGGDIHFGPDGYLYIGMGDGGGGNDPLRRSQDPNSLLGKMLRIDVDRNAPSPRKCGLVGDYAIPADNPRATASGACNEIWADGLRNPWRFSFDRETGDLLIGDVGQGQIEEIDLLPAGVSDANFGWPCREGHLANPNASNATCNPPLTEPILHYSHSEGGCSVTGGFRYRGRYSPLRGTYLFADYCSGIIWFAVDDENGSWTRTVWQDTSIRISSFGEDDTGEIYLASIGGAIYRLQTPATGMLPAAPGGLQLTTTF